MKRAHRESRSFRRGTRSGRRQAHVDLVARWWDEGMKIENGCTSLVVILDKQGWRDEERVLRYRTPHSEYGKVEKLYGFINVN